MVFEPNDAGLAGVVDPIECRESIEIITVSKLPGPNKYANITLKWGITDSHELCSLRMCEPYT